MPTGAMASAEEIAELRRQMQILLDRVDELEAKEAANKKKIADVERAQVVTKDGITPLPRPSGIIKTRKRTSPDELDPLIGRVFAVGDTQIEVGGFTKLDLIFDPDEAAGEDLFNPAAITVEPGTDANSFSAHAKETRFFVKSATPVDVGTVRTHIEADFFSDTGPANELVTNSFGFRLRHAYGEFDTDRHNVIAGQFWSAFVPIEAYPVTVDFGGPAGNTFLRQAQLRYTYRPTDEASLFVSVENSETDFRIGPLEEFGPFAGTFSGPFSESLSGASSVGLRAGVDVIPDFVVGGKYVGDRATWRLAALFRQLNAPDSDSSDFAFGIQGAAKIAITDKTELRTSFTYGEGVGRYIFQGVGQGGFVTPGASGALPQVADGTIEAIEHVSGFAKLSYDLSDDVELAAVYGHYELLDAFTDFDTERLQTVHGTVYYKPFDDITVGNEVIWGRRELANGLSDAAIRFQSSVKYTF
ncbi:MAG: DcaP family trimeric outer membrane transporter [Pseudomonadota bacterium]